MTFIDPQNEKLKRKNSPYGVHSISHNQY